MLMEINRVCLINPPVLSCVEYVTREGQGEVYGEVSKLHTVCYAQVLLLT